MCAEDLLGAVTMSLLLAVATPLTSLAATNKTALLPQGATNDPPTFVACPSDGKPPVLTFDLRALPTGAAIETAQLRLVPQVKARPVGVLDKTGEVLAAAKLAAQTVTISLQGPQCGAFSGVSLFSGNATNAAYRPRLIISWRDDGQPIQRKSAQLRYRGNPEDQTPWRIVAPKKATLFKSKFTELLAGPAFSNDQVLVIATSDTAPQAMLHLLGWNGVVIERCVLPPLGRETSQWADLSVLPSGGLVAFANDRRSKNQQESEERVQVFDFGPRDARGCPSNTTGRWTSASSLKHHPVATSGGIIVFADRENEVYALAPPPTLDELWRTQKMANTTQLVLGQASEDDLLYVLRKRDLLGLSPATGDILFPKQSGPESHPLDAFPLDKEIAGYGHRHPPLTVHGPKHDWVLLSGYGTNSAALKVIENSARESAFSWKESLKGPVSRCVVPPSGDPEEPIVYCAQNDRFSGFRVSNGTEWCKHVDEKLNAVSSLVADGGGNVYFMSGGPSRSDALFGFDRRCSRLFRQPLQTVPGPPEGETVMDLRVSPKGILYTWSHESLFAIRLVQNDLPAVLESATRHAVEGDIELSQGTMLPPDGPVIVEAIKGRMSFADFKVPEGASVSCSATSAFDFHPGFSVEQGGELSCSFLDESQIVPEPKPGQAAAGK